MSAVLCLPCYVCRAMSAALCLLRYVCCSIMRGCFVLWAALPSKSYRVADLAFVYCSWYVSWQLL